MSNLNFDVIRERNSMIIFVSQLVTSVADKMLSIGLIWYITKNLGPNIVPWFLACAFLPHLIFSFFSTKIIHHVGTIKTVINTTIFRGLVLLIYFLILSFFNLSSAHFANSLFVMIFLIGVGSSLFTPAILSCPPLLVDEDKVIALNGLLDSTISIATILGAVLSVFILNYVEIQGLLLINAICFISSFFLLLMLKKKNEENNSENLEQGNHVSPVTVLRKYPAIAKMLFSFLVLNLVLAPIFVLMPWYVQQVYAGDSSTLATIEGALGLGAFLMGILISVTKFEVKAQDRVKMIAIITFIFGVCFSLFALSSKPWQGALVLFFFGSFLTFLNIQVLTYFQTEALADDVPAIMTSVNLISNASMPISLTLSGVIFPLVNVPTFALVSGLITILLAFILPPLIKGDHL
jgi:MFS family permease